MIDNIFDILKFTGPQRQEIEVDLNNLIKAQTINQLIAMLPYPEHGSLKNSLSDSKTIADSQDVASILLKHFSPKVIAENEEKALGVVLVSYLSHLMRDVSNAEREKIKKILEMHKVDFN